MKKLDTKSSQASSSIIVFYCHRTLFDTAESDLNIFELSIEICSINRNGNRKYPRGLDYLDFLMGICNLSILSPDVYLEFPSPNDRSSYVKISEFAKFSTV